jgi:hypothetical protein
MKKKIINGILMVALLAATSTSFVSCKDNDEDVKTELTAQFQAADNALNNVIQAQLANKANQSDLDAFKAAVQDGYVTKVEFNTFKEGLDQDLQDLWNALNDTEDPTSVASRLAAQQQDINGIQEDLTEINNRIKAIEDALKNLITSVTVNATSTGILENSKLFPGINMQFLGAVFGEADQAGEFPSTDAGEYVAGHGVVLTEAEIAGAKTIDWNKKDILPKAENGKSAAGKVYFTVNPSNITLGEGVNLSLINSQDKEGYLSLGAAKVSGKVLSWGTRAEAENGVKLYEAPAYIELDADGVAVVDPTEMINFKDIAGNIKEIIDNAKGVQKSASSVKSTSKEILKSTADIVTNIVMAKVPSLPAVALKAQWEDVVGPRSVISDYSIAATAVKPLSLRFGKVSGGVLPTISLDRIDNFVAQIADSVKSKFPDFSKYVVNNITISDKYVSVNVYYSEPINVYKDGNLVGSGNITIDRNYGDWVYLNDIQDQVNDNFVAMINSMLKDMTNLTNEIGKYTDRTVNATDLATDYLQNLINKVILKINNDGLTSVLEPILLVQGDFGVKRFSAKTEFNAGQYKVLPTTMTNEFIAPLYKKYVAILKDGQIVKAWNLTRGDADANGFTYDFAQGNYTVVYAGLDFFGNQIAKRYNLTVK